MTLLQNKHNNIIQIRQEKRDHPYRILIVGGSRSGKINALLNLINHEVDIDKIYLYAAYPYKAK